MKEWEIIRFDHEIGLTREVVIGNTIYDALMNTGNLTDFEIISMKLVTHDI
jgi:hypothetical protein